MRTLSPGDRRFVAIFLAGLLVFMAGCGGNEPAEPEDSEATGTLAAVEENLRDIRSGRVAMAIRVTSPDAEPSGWEMQGPFQAAEDEEQLPLADLAYIDRAGDSIEESRFVADGDRAWVVTATGPKALEEESLEALKGGEDPAGIRTLRLTNWIRGEAQQQPGEPIDGEATTTYTGEVNAVGAMRDLLVLAANMGAYVPRTLTGTHPERVQEAVQGAELQVVAKIDDDLLRKMTLSIDLASGSTELRDGIGALSGSRIEFEMTINEINQPIEVPAPPEGAERPPPPKRQPTPEPGRLPGASEVGEE